MVLLTAGLFGAQAAPASPPTSRAACDGVRLLAAPYIAIGIGGLTLELSGPLDDRVLCQAIDLPQLAGAKPTAAKRHCDNAQVSGAQLRPSLAAEATSCLINKQRSAHGLRSLDPQRTLKKAAKRHTEQMLSAGCFSHACPGEADLVGRVTSAGYLPCSCTWSVGENLAWGLRKYGSPAAIVSAWMASPPHRATILTASLREVDIGVRPGKPGARNAKAATYTADFGYRN